MNIRDLLKNPLRRPLAYVGAEWGRLAPRERKLIGALAGSLVTAVVLVGIFLVYQNIADLSERTEDTREALAAIAKYKDDFLEQKARAQAQEVRIGSQRPQLAADLEAAAHEAGIQIAETADAQPVPAGKRYMEYSVTVSLRSVDLLQLSKFLAKVETGPRLIVTNRMSIRRGFGEADKMEVSVTATAYERVKDSAPKKRGPGNEKGNGNSNNNSRDKG